MTNLPPQNRLQELLYYEQKTGLLFWRGRKDKAWNARWEGKPALANLHKATGYLRGTIDGKTYLSHRIIWKLITSNDPNYIDHIDGNPTNNRWNNLTNGTAKQNARNQKLRCDNASGGSGVSWCSTNTKWLVQIGTDSGKQTIGLFNDQEDAITARRGIERILGYTARHGT